MVTLAFIWGWTKKGSANTNNRCLPFESLQLAAIFYRIHFPFASRMVIELNFPQRWIEIPKQFHSLYHEGPFPKCVDCECDLLNEPTQYFIERVFRGKEPICEMAMCLDCREKIAEELSEESMVKMKMFTDERFDPEMRLQQAS